jgi:hypothetical protein
MMPDVVERLATPHEAPDSLDVEGFLNLATSTFSCCAVMTGRRWASYMYPT